MKIEQRHGKNIYKNEKKTRKQNVFKDIRTSNQKYKITKEIQNKHEMTSIWGH